MYHVIFSFISLLVIGSTLSIENDTLQTYNAKVCNNEPTCSLINEPYLPELKRTLEGRDCMCDSDCVEYDDCCADSEFYARTFNRSGKSYWCHSKLWIYMVANCPAGYSDQAVLSKCLASQKPLNGPDNSVIRPATNIKTRTTYGNIYCALCNNDFNVVLWNLSAKCGEVPAGYFDSPQTPIPATSETNKEISSQPTEISTKPSKAEISTTSAQPKVEIPTTSAKPKVTSTTASSKTSKPLISLSLGANPSLEINIGNKNFKPTLNTGTGLFRPKRQKPGIDFSKFRKDWDNILENVHYDGNTQSYISQYNGKPHICEFDVFLSRSFEINVRKCVTDMISSCPSNTDQKTAQKCSSYTAIVYDTKTAETLKPYKNRDCAKCNNVVEGLTGCPPQRIRDNGSGLFSTSDKGATPPCDQPEIKNSPMCTG